MSNGDEPSLRVVRGTEAIDGVAEHPRGFEEFFGFGARTPLRGPLPRDGGPGRGGGDDPGRVPPRCGSGGSASPRWRSPRRTYPNRDEPVPQACAPRCRRRPQGRAPPSEGGRAGRSCQGPLEPGQYHATYFDPTLAFEIASLGWTWRYVGNFQMLAADESAEGLDADVINFFLFIGDRVPGLQGGPEPGVERSVDDLVAWLQGAPGLTTSKGTPVTVGGLEGVRLDLKSLPSGADVLLQRREAGGATDLSSAFPGGYNWAISRPTSMRWYVLDAGNRVLIVDIEDNPKGLTRDLFSARAPHLIRCVLSPTLLPPTFRFLTREDLGDTTLFDFPDLEDREDLVPADLDDRSRARFDPLLPDGDESLGERGRRLVAPGVAEACVPAQVGDQEGADDGRRRGRDGPSSWLDIRVHRTLHPPSDDQVAGLSSPPAVLRTRADLPFKRLARGRCGWRATSCALPRGRAGTRR